MVMSFLLEEGIGLIVYLFVKFQWNIVLNVFKPGKRNDNDFM